MKNLISILLIGVISCFVSSCDQTKLKAENELLRQQIDSLLQFTQIQKPSEKALTTLDQAKAALRDRTVDETLGNRIEVDEVKRDTTAFLDFRRNIKPCLDAQGVILSSSYSFGLKEIEELMKDTQKIFLLRYFSLH